MPSMAGDHCHHTITGIAATTSIERGRRRREQDDRRSDEHAEPGGVRTQRVRNDERRDARTDVQHGRDADGSLAGGDGHDGGDCDRPGQRLGPEGEPTALREQQRGERDGAAATTQAATATVAVPTAAARIGNTMP
jgi:hypothetical protein